MHTERMAILTDQRPENYGDDGLRWLVMQSLKHGKWVLAVIHGDFSEYYVTDLMSERAELIVQYADYLNKGIVGNEIDRKRREMLEQLREKYRSS